jgi:adenylosuccinate lyase
MTTTPATNAMQDSALMECAEALAALEAKNERLRAENEALRGILAAELLLMDSEVDDRVREWQGKE